jgi:cystathionine beta-lyase/cystathionine gamma-synthase
MDLVLQKTDDSNPPHYCRSFSDESLRCAEFFKNSYGQETFVVPSGLASIATALNVALRDMMKISKGKCQINLIHGDELYSDTPHVFSYWQQAYDFSTLKFSANSDQTLLDLVPKIEKQLNILFVESCSNPSSTVFNFDLIPILKKKSRKLIVICDNTWLSSAVCNPFTYGADIVVSSTTKYYSGGSCIGGIIMAVNQSGFLDKIRRHISMNGLHTSPLSCDLLAKNLSSLQSRITKSSKLTCEIAAYLVSKNIVCYHSSLGENAEKASKFFYSTDNRKFTDDNVVLHPSVILFEIPLPLTQAIEWIKSTGIAFETSFGNAHSKICNFVKAKDDVTTFCRLSVGFDDKFEELSAKLTKFDIVLN